MAAGGEAHLVGVVLPVLDEAAVRAAQDDFAVKREHKALVGRDVEDEGLVPRVELGAEAHDARPEAGDFIDERGVPDPGGLVDGL